MTIPGNIQKYLANYSVGDRWNIVSESFDEIDNVVVIPAIAESGHIFKTLASLSKNPRAELSRTLVVCVINNGDADNVPANELADNQYTLKVLDNREQPPVLFNSVRQSGLRIAYVDVSSPGLEMPDKIAGVGLARKIGMDLALVYLTAIWIARNFFSVSTPTRWWSITTFLPCVNSSRWRIPPHL